MSDHVDKQFFAAIRSGDRERIDKTFGQVYVTYVKLVAFVVGKYICDKETVKEITNDTFLNLFNHAGSVRGSIKYYLVVSARNAAINHLKKQKTEGYEVPLEYATERPYKEYGGRSEVIDDLKKVLSAEQTDIILLHVAEGYSFKEIAAMKNKNLNTIITIYNRAIKKYKKEAGKNER